MSARDERALPSVSVVMATLNAARYLDDCLASVRAQDYPPDRVEIVIGDGGSTDETLAIAARHGVATVVPNPRQTGEAGKAVALRHATGDVVLSLDADNYLVGTDWLRRVVQPLVDDPTVFAAEAVRWHYRRTDPPVNRYFMLAGVTEPISLFVGNYGHLSQVTGRWNGYGLPEEARDGYLVATLDPDHVPAMGANGFVVRRAVLDTLTIGDYYFDIDAVAELVRAGHTRIAKVDIAVGHSFARDLRTYARKQRRRIQDFLHFRGERRYDWMGDRRAGVVKFVLATVTVVPLVAQMVAGWRRQRDVAWLYHLPVCWLTLVLYAGNVVLSPLRRGPHSRAGWRH